MKGVIWRGNEGIWKKKKKKKPNGKAQYKLGRMDMGTKD
jgi:hypothetical protein